MEPLSQDLYSYLHGLQGYIQTLEKRISKLEKKVVELEDETRQLQNRPPVHIDTIEYKFDQLKVETLEGTLNIGLNPTDLQEQIEEFAIDNKDVYAPNIKGSSPPPSPKDFMYHSMGVENEMYRYLEQDLPEVIEDVQAETNVSLDESYINFIKEDILKQLPKRIDYYLKKEHAAIAEEELQDHVTSMLKQEIRNGVSIFANNLPENMRGDKRE
ncbi:MAG: spore germination protein GerPC [Cytobacillus gottheilii]|uniref:spore germination protein GerPC n=1 Tax=Cytobacillus gottheilii TaxID=859144 RepID=UPI003464BAB9